MGVCVWREVVDGWALCVCVCVEGGLVCVCVEGGVGWMGGVCVCVLGLVMDVLGADPH